MSDPGLRGTWVAVLGGGGYGHGVLSLSRGEGGGRGSLSWGAKVTVRRVLRPWVMLSGVAFQGQGWRGPEGGRVSVPW